jgi:HD superfamily phosphohydrolase
MSQSFIVKDKLYGEGTIASPVLIALIESKPIQRLKKITQYGVPDEYNAAFIRNNSRYEHSLGTMVLLKNIGATEEEQIAGLLHDASHTAFSHVIDWVVGSFEKQDYQDNQHENIITTSEIAGILRKFGYDPERISNYKLFSLLEQPVPNACADRVDYSLREFPPQAIKTCVKALVAKNGRIAFIDKEAATIFALNYLITQEDMWSNNESATRYLFFANILKIAMKKNIISFADFQTDDVTIINKLHAAKDNQINKLFLIMQQYKRLSYLPKTTRTIPKKFRYIDPEILVGNKVVRLSTFDKDFAQEVARAKKENAKGVAIPRLLEEW